jgi:2-phospho-L-lactate/phosphoenolpyruvate guanylyltransferase
MTTVAILPVKRFPAAKTRLDSSFTPGQRKALAEAMVTDVLIALRRTPEIDVSLVVTGEPSASALALGYGAEVVDDPDDAGHHAAVRIGIREAIAEHGADRVVLIPGDCPALDPADLSALLRGAPRGRSVVVVPDRHGDGTNALVLTPPEVMHASFGPGSRARHEAAAAEAGAACEVVPAWSLVLDVDTGEDLDALRAALDAHPGGAAHVRGLLGRLARQG